MVKKIRSIFIIVVLMAIILDFIPIKFAVKLSDNLTENDGVYICSHEQVTGGNWRVENYKNQQLYFDNLMGNSPFKYLSKIYRTDYIEPSGNMYLLQGDILLEEQEVYDLNVNKWDIIYPISRKSIRALYVPPDYLTIYDYDWIKILEQILTRVI